MGYLPIPDIKRVDFSGIHAGTWNNDSCKYQLTEEEATSDTGDALEGLVRSFVGSLTITQAESAECGVSTPLKAFVIAFDSPAGNTWRYLFIERKLSNGSFQTAKAACEYDDVGQPSQQHIFASNDNPEYGVGCRIDDLSYYSPPPAP